MAGDAPDWSLPGPNEIGSLTLSQLYLTGTATANIGAAVIPITNTIPAGLTFYITGMSFGHECTVAGIMCLCRLRDSGAILNEFVSQYGDTHEFATPIPLRAGHVIDAQLFFTGGANGDTLTASIWGWQK